MHYNKLMFLKIISDGTIPIFFFLIPMSNPTKIFNFHVNFTFDFCYLKFTFIINKQNVFEAFCLISWIIDIQCLYLNCLKLFTISHCNFTIIYSKKVNYSFFLQSA